MVVKSAIGSPSPYRARLYPNGECVVWKARTFKPHWTSDKVSRQRVEYQLALFRLCNEYEDTATALAAALGLANLPIFDIAENGVVERDVSKQAVRKAKGLDGISSYGRRLVRNAAHLLEDNGRRCLCVFATVTVPSVPYEQLAAIHKRWNEVIERYRLGITRALKAKGLSGEMVVVSEIQEKRHDKTGIPVLHAHSVFHGVTKNGKFALSTELHDDIWYRALSVAARIERHDVAVACNLQRVRKSASGYLGKYMTKGALGVRRAVDQGFGDWMPRHWFSCSRTLMNRVKAETRRVDDLGYWLYESPKEGADNLWIWHREVSIEFADGNSLVVAVYGQLKPEVSAGIHAGFKDVKT